MPGKILLVHELGDLAARHAFLRHRVRAEVIIVSGVARLNSAARNKQNRVIEKRSWRGLYAPRHDLSKLFLD